MNPSPTPGSTAPRHTVASPKSLWSFGLITVAAIALRLFLLRFPHHGGDFKHFSWWGELLTAHPASEAYEPSLFTPDHLPPDIIIHWALSHGFRSFSSEGFTSPSYVLYLRLFPMVADLLLAAAVCAALWIAAGRVAALRGYALVLFAPPVLLTGPVWGQWDSLSLMLLAVGAALTLRFRRIWGLFLVFPIYAVFIKPPLAVIVLPFALFPLLVLLLTASNRGAASTRRDLAAYGANLFGGTALGLLVVEAVSRPFNSSLLPGQAKFDIPGLIAVAADKFQLRTLNSPNLWGFLQHPKERISDAPPLLFGLSAHQWGLVLFLLFSLAVGIIALLATLRRAGAGYTRLRLWVIPLWAACSFTWASNFFLTRAHERYLLPAVVLAIPLALILRNRAAWLALILVTASATICIYGALLNDRQIHLPFALWILACILNALGGALLLALGRSVMRTPLPRRALRR